MSKAIRLIAVLITTLSIAACSGSGAQSSDFSATTLDGDEFNLAGKRGEVVALYFMAAY